MANILLLDDSEVAGRAMQGILARGHHTCFVAGSPEEAWQMLREGVIFDLVIMEMKLPGNGGMQFLQRVREDWFWKILPVVVYTYETEVKTVRKALALKVQNYLIKPYTDQLVFAEIAKATLNPWRNLHFEEAKSFCSQMEILPDGLAKMRREVMVAYDQAAQTFPHWTHERSNEEVFTRIQSLATQAESAGIWAAVDYLRDLQANAEAGNWAAFRTSGEYLDYASRLIFCQLNPSFVPDCMRSQADVNEAKEASERTRWNNANVDANGPMLDAEIINKQIAGLPGCPVIDTIAAAFHMAADGRAASMNQVMDLVSSDPGLCAQVIIAANRAEHDEMTVIDDARAAVNLLGEIKLNALAKALPTARERHLNAAPLTWPNFWMYQVTVGKVAQFVCNYLEFTYLNSTAYTAGLLHDVGKLVLLKLHPFALQNIVRYARDNKVPFRHGERKYLGCTTRDIGVKFAELNRLPKVYTNVIRWVETPASADENADLIAMVSLARHICLLNQVGFCGEIPTQLPPITATPAWEVLQPRLFPSFDQKKFEVQAQAYCVTLRQELSGARPERAASTARRVAQLV